MKEREDSKRGGGRERLFEGAINRGTAIFRGNTVVFLLLADHNKLLKKLMFATNFDLPIKKNEAFVTL